MSHTPSFTPYQASHFDNCLALFDANCPDFFAPNERADYAEFLEKAPDGYFVSTVNNEIAGAFGLIDENISRRRRLNWIMINPNQQGNGLGRAIMNYVIDQAKVTNTSIIDIAASHLSAAFFERFGGQCVLYTEHGWGSDMHRLDMELKL